MHPARSRHDCRRSRATPSFRPGAGRLGPGRGPCLRWHVPNVAYVPFDGSRSIGREEVGREPRPVVPGSLVRIGAGGWPLIPVLVDRHPLGCHRPRSLNRDCFEVMFVRLSTGCSWEDAERLCGNKVSDTTVRVRRDEWLAAGVFDAIAEEAMSAYDRIIGLDLSDVAVDGSLHKSPCGGEERARTRRIGGKLGWKWSVLTDRNGIPIGWTIEGPTATTRSCSRRPSTPPRSGDCSARSRPSGSTAARTPAPPENASPSATSTTPSSPGDAPEDLPSRRRTSRWDCAGRSSGPTRGSPTSASNDATPTAEPCTASLNSLSPSPSCSPPSSSTGETAGHPTLAYPLSL